MKKIIKMIIIFSLICLVQYPEIQSQEIKIESKYAIDGRTVTEAEFNQFKDSLKEIKGTWYCRETSTGGVTGYEAKDINGIIYEIISISDSKTDENSIRRKNP